MPVFDPDIFDFDIFAAEIGITIGPAVEEYALPALDFAAGLDRTLGPAVMEFTLISPDVHVLRPLGPVLMEFALITMQPVLEHTIGPVAMEYALDMGITQARVIVGPAAMEFAIVALDVQNLVNRTLGPVVQEYALLVPVGDYEQFRTLGPVVQEYAAAGFNLRQRPSLIRVTLRGPTWFIHSAWWPRHQLAVLSTAASGDRSFVGTQSLQQAHQPGQASVSISARDPQITPDILRHGNLLVCESPGFPTWAGPILNIEEQQGAAIGISALSLEALLDGRVTHQAEEYTGSIGESVVFRSLVDGANARNHTGILAALELETGQSVEQLQVGGQSVMDAINEMTARTGSEWWLDISRSPRKLTAIVRLGYQQGTDYSGTLHLYQGTHFTGAYKSDLSQVRSSVTAVGDFGRELPDRNSVARFSDAPGADFGAAHFDRAGETTLRQLRTLPAGLHNEKMIFEVMTGNTAELSAVARRAHERPLGAGEMFNDFINSLVDPRYLRIGNYYTRHGEHQGRQQVRVVRIVGMQPDEPRGTEVVLEVAQ